MRKNAVRVLGSDKNQNDSFVFLRSTSQTFDYQPQLPYIRRHRDDVEATVHGTRALYLGH